MAFETTVNRETNHRDVLIAVREILLAELGDLGLNDQTIELTDSTEPPSRQAADKLFITMTGTDSEFPDDTQTGGAQRTCEELAGVLIAVYSTMRLDQVGKMPSAIFDSDQGLLEVKRRILAALVGNYPTSNQKQLLSDCIKIRRATFPKKIPGSTLYEMELEFGIPFFWDLVR